jgi:hypothetical protein
VGKLEKKNWYLKKRQNAFVDSMPVLVCGWRKWTDEEQRAAEQVALLFAFL